MTLTLAVSRVSRVILPPALQCSAQTLSLAHMIMSAMHSLMRPYPHQPVRALLIAGVPHVTVLTRLHLWVKSALPRALSLLLTAV
jgi:hypothetical protein